MHEMFEQHLNILYITYVVVYIDFFNLTLSLFFKVFLLLAMVNVLYAEQFV